MTTTDNRIPVLCTLARHHKGDHDEHSAVRARIPCGAIVRYDERVAEEACPPVDPVEVATDGATFNPADRGCGMCHPDRYSDGEGSVLCHDHAAEYAIGKPFPGGAPLPPPTPPAPVPAAPVMTPEEVQRVAESATEDAMKTMVPAEPPPLAHLIAEAIFRAEKVETRKREVERARADQAKAEEVLSGVHSDIARRVGRGALVGIGGALFRSVPPRKPRSGEVAADALWKLEPVEVKK